MDDMATNAPALRELLDELLAVDQAVYDAATQTSAPELDRWLGSLSNAANRSVLWLVIAAALAALGGRRGRRAATRGLTSIAVTSALVNIGLKGVNPRQRPERHEDPGTRRVRMPESSSFPSGHSASGFAFASAVGLEVPLLALPLRGLAAAVAYSRVHCGVHFPADVVVGSLVGAVTGQVVSRALDHAAGP
jgi:undecaprenyl-diphosphatase